MSKQIVKDFLSLLSPNAFVQNHSLISKEIPLNFSGASRFLNKSLFWEQTKIKQQQKISSGLQHGQDLKENLNQL